MKGMPKYMYKSKVKFDFNGEEKQGEVYIIDRDGTFEFPNDVSYDIYVKNENMLYKHITEQDVKPL